MAPLERAMVVSYRLSIVTVALSVTIRPQFAMRKKHGVEGRKLKEGRKEECHSTTCDNKLNENHRLDSDLSTYNKLGGIPLCITEMAMH